MNSGADIENAPAALTLVGCGRMGGALLQIWLEAFAQTRFHVIEPAGLPAAFQNNKNVTHAAGATAQIRGSDIIVLAVKPQIMASACAALKPHLDVTTLVLSIAAGQSLENFSKMLGAEQPVIRAMPNTPAAIGKGMTVAVAGKNVTAAGRKTAHALLMQTGAVHWAEDESLLDAVTALSGSGPAYVFYLIEVLASAGAKAGLEPGMAMALARQTVIGAAALAEQAPQTQAATLRENVTSPGGTTAAALEILMNGELEDLFARALAAAKKRGAALNS
jgi:pyrroline-5-carboxylate reductase